MIEQQQQLKADMIGMGAKKFRDSVITSRGKGNETNSPYGITSQI